MEAMYSIISIPKCIQYMSIELDALFLYKLNIRTHIISYVKYMGFIMQHRLLYSPPSAAHQVNGIYAPFVAGLPP